MRREWSAVRASPTTAATGWSEASGTITPTLSYNIAYAYDSVGNPVQKTYTLPGMAQPVQVVQTWDANNRLTNIARSAGASTVNVAKTYTAAGRLDTVLSRTNGVASAFTDYEYDSTGRISNVQHCTNATCTTVRSRFSYTYDADGNRISRDRAQGRRADPDWL